ncbi:MAG: cytochrome-c oxidase, cbb3-type subunit II, partial [Polyangiaceae bacterium]
ATVVVVVEDPSEASWREIVFAKPVGIVAGVGASVAIFGVANAYASPLFAVVAFTVAILGAVAMQATGTEKHAWHRLLEGRALIFSSFTLIAVLVGGIAEIIPSLMVSPNITADTKPYSPLELEGRDIYIREGCYNCHSQMIRYFRWESQRYGEPSKMEDSQFDHPFQWGSKRTGPDLAREGGKYPNLWHYRHLSDPRSVSPGSNMPPYGWLATTSVASDRTADKMQAMKSIGVPYTDTEIETAQSDERKQSDQIAADLASSGEHVDSGSDMIALVSFLQRLGATPQPPVKSGVAAR